MNRLFPKLSVGMVLAALVITGFGPAIAATPAEIKRMVIAEARKTAVPASLALAVAKAESNLRPDHEGSDGARGLMQILPETAESMGVAPASLWDPESNLKLGLKLLSGVLERKEGRWEDAVVVYASPRRAPKSTASQRYVASVLNWERSYAEQLALQDVAASRRRDILAANRADAPSKHDFGHDEWAQEDRQPSDGGRDGGVSDVTIYRGRVDDEIEITVYDEPDWRAAPPPSPPRWSPRSEPRPRWRPRHRMRGGPGPRGGLHRMARRIARTFRRH